MDLLLSCQAITKSFGSRPLFENLSVGIFEGERLGLIGPNGAGKSTLLKILAAVDTPDKGTRSLKKMTTLGYLPQHEDFPPEKTVSEILLETIQQEEIDEAEGFTQMQILLSKVGFSQTEQKVKTLSGGWKKRLSIAKVLLQNPDLILMDEPTNHLDLEGILWLEELLREASFAFILISHDRYFLEDVTNRILEINPQYPEGSFSSKGNYSEFLLKRDEFLQGQLQTQASLANKVRREVDWLQRGPKARTTKANYRIKEAEQMIESLAEIKSRTSLTQKVDIDFSGTEKKTKKLLVVQDLEKRFEEKTIVKKVNLTLSPGSRFGLIGKNGSGKSTLLKLLSGQLIPDQGTVTKADELRIVTFDQNREQVDKSLTLREALTPSGGDSVQYQGRLIHVASWAKRFLFQAEQLEMPVAQLSGGEQARILIALLMLQPADLLLLDEPTNDLDIPSLEVLEDSLQEFPGAIVMVTHDRFLMEKISSQVIGLDQVGDTAIYTGYQQWLQAQKEKANASATQKLAEKAQSKAKNQSRKALIKEKRELEQVEKKIATAEKNLEEKQQQLEDPSIASNMEKLQTCTQQIEEAQIVVDKLYARWEELEEKLSS